MSKSNNIFFNQDTFALSFPLISLCSTYAYFKFVPLEIGLPLIGFLILVYQMNTKLAQRRAEKSQDEILDDSFLEEDDTTNKKKAPKKNKKAGKGLKNRKNGTSSGKTEAKESNTNNDADDDDWDEDAAMLAFTKGNKKSK